jgi:hypothetical protein
MRRNWAAAGTAFRELTDKRREETAQGGELRE